MKVYFDVLSNDELISDSYPTVLLYDDVVMEVASRMVVKGNEDVDIGRGNEFGGGGEDEAVDNTSQRVNDIVSSFSLQETSFTKKEYVAVIKAYMQKLGKHLAGSERVEIFKKGATEFVKWVVANFNEFKFYSGPSYDQSAMIVLSYYKQESNEAPHFLFIRDGLREEKY
jgi:hypothetical protein